MKPTLSKILTAVCIFALLSVASAQPTATLSPTWQVYFSPGGEVTYAICRALNRAKSTVLVQAYLFTSAPIAEALEKAHKRGVNVQVILYRSQRTQKYSSADFLANSGIPTRIDAAHAIAHNKIMVIDNDVVITGSFNFTKAAEEMEGSCPNRMKRSASRFSNGSIGANNRRQLRKLLPQLGLQFSTNRDS